MKYKPKQRILTEESLVAEKHLKKCSTFLVIREMKIKMTLRFYLIPIRMSGTKNSSKENTFPLLVGVQSCTTTLEINLSVPQKFWNRSNSRSTYNTPAYIHKRSSTIAQVHLLNYVHISFVCSSQKQETT